MKKYLTSSEEMQKQTISWPGPTMGRRSFTWRGIPSTIMFCTLVIPVTRPYIIFCGKSSMWSLYPHSVTRFENGLQSTICWCQCSIDSFQPYAIPIHHIGWCCSRRYVILWRDVVPIYCFWYSTLFSGGNPFYSSDIAQ